MTSKTKKIISGILIISIIFPTVLFSNPKKVNADVIPVIDAIGNGLIGAGNLVLGEIAGVDTTNTATTIKDWVWTLGKEALKITAKKLLATMTQQTVNWINSGFSGSPLFVENPESFFNDIAKSELKKTVDVFGYDSLVYPFGKQFAMNAINSYKSQLSDNLGYSLSKVMNSTEQYNYRNNFNYGGWNGFLINTQYPQNNYLGSQMQMTEYLAQKLQGTSQSIAQQQTTLLQQGMGFLSPQECKTNKEYDNSTNAYQKPSFQFNVPFNCSTESDDGIYTQCQRTWESQKEAARAEWAKKNVCPKGLSGTTPGAAVANQLFNAMDSPRLMSALDGALGNSLSVILDALINKFVGGFLDKGLNKLSGESKTEPVDNWSYDGNTLNGNTPAVGALNIPQNVSVYVGQTTSTTISGGSGSYSIKPQSNLSTMIAVATIDTSGNSGTKLKITAGTTLGSTSVEVYDSNNPEQFVTVTITVNAVGALVVFPANISVNPNANGQVIAKISGGTEPYSIQRGPNEKNAIVILAGTNLIVTGMEGGNTSVIIKDSSIPNKFITIPIIVGFTILTISPSEPIINVGQTADLTIENGRPPYFITNQEDPITATAQIPQERPTHLYVNGNAIGTSTITIQDSSSPTKTATFTITVRPIGTPVAQ